MSAEVLPTPARLATKCYGANTVISAEGDPAGAWYVLIKGSVGVFKGKVKISEFNKRGSVFGESSSLLQRNRSATLRALEDTELLSIEATLDQLIVHHPDIVKTIIVSLAERLVKTTDAFWMVSEKQENAKALPSLAAGKRGKSAKKR